MQENWSYGGVAWKYRGMTDSIGSELREVALDASGLHQVYDAPTNSILEIQDETVANLTELKVADKSYKKMIREWIMNEGENRTLRFDIYEKLPGTPGNLGLLNLRVAYPSATVYPDPAASKQALTKAQAE